MSNRGFELETPFIDLEIYRLVSLVAASRQLAEFQADESDGGKWEHLRLLEFQELSRLLISIAAFVRSGLDANPVSGGFYSTTLERPVGILYPDVTDQERVESLSLRDACNKVLHAKKVEPRWGQAAQDHIRYLTKNVILYGDYRGHDWRAMVDLYQFALAAVVMI